MRYEIGLLFVAIVWGLNYRILPAGVQEFGAINFTIWRFVFSSALLLVLLTVIKNVQFRREDLFPIILVGLVGTTAYQFTFAAGVAETNAVDAAIIFSLAPIFTLGINAITGREKIRLHHYLGGVMAVVGTAIVVTRNSIPSMGTEHLFGNALMLLAAFLFALYAHVSEHLLKTYGGIHITAWSGLFGAMGLVAIGMASGELIEHPSIDVASNAALWSLLFAIIGATVFGVSVFYAAVPHIGSRRVMATMFLVPVVAILVDFSLGTATLGLRELLGITLVLCGVYLTKTADFSLSSLPQSKLGRVRK